MWSEWILRWLDGVWIGFYWLTIGTGGDLLWMRWWIFGFLRRGVSNMPYFDKNATLGSLLHAFTILILYTYDWGKIGLRSWPILSFCPIGCPECLKKPRRTFYNNRSFGRERRTIIRILRKLTGRKVFGKNIKYKNLKTEWSWMYCLLRGIK
jgi:hypothetical protein